MYKFLGLGMIGVFAMMVIPGGNFDAGQGEQTLYGMATIVKNDSQGNEVFQQSIHNNLTDQGSDYILDAIFSTSSEAVVTAQAFGAICVSDQTANEGDQSIEDDTASSFDSPNGLNDTTNLTCEDDQGDVTFTGQVATIGALTFDSVDNIDVGETINSIGICQKDVDNSGDAGFVDCELGGDGTPLGLLLAVVSVTATTLGSGETVDITYTFDLTSNDS